MNESFTDIYDRLIEGQEKREIQSSNFAKKPIMIGGAITPDSSVIIQPVFGVEFSIDRDGMHEILKNLERTISQQTEEQNQNLMWVSYAVSSVIYDYLGGYGNSQERQNAYISNNDHLTLSEIKNKKIGLCAERASVAQNCLVVLKEVGILKNFTPQLTNSHLTVDGNREPHAFIMFIRDEKEKSSWLFDIENNIEYIKNDGKTEYGIALYQVPAKELEEFKQGKSFKLKSAYELTGMQVCGQDRYYGSEDLRTLQAKLEEKEKLKKEEQELIEEEQKLKQQDGKNLSKE